MQTYEIKITEWNNDRTKSTVRTHSIGSFSRTPKGTAQEIISVFNVRDGANVRFAKMGFDPTTDSFRVTEFTFDVIDGKEDNLVAL